MGVLPQPLGRVLRTPATTLRARSAWARVPPVHQTGVPAPHLHALPHRRYVSSAAEDEVPPPVKRITRGAWRSAIVRPSWCMCHSQCETCTGRCWCGAASACLVDRPWHGPAYAWGGARLERHSSRCAPSHPSTPPSADDVVMQFARSSGAGGQHVNKVNTKVDMRMKLDAADWLHPKVRQALERQVCACVHTRRESECVSPSPPCLVCLPVRRVLCAFPCVDDRMCPNPAAQERRRINKDVELIVTSQRTRSQA